MNALPALPLAAYFLLLAGGLIHSSSIAGVPQRDFWRPAEAQALEEFLIRKEPLATGGTRSGAMRQMIARQSTAPQMLHGYMAEGLFLERRQGWKPVAAPNAPFNDVYRFAPDRSPPLNGQIKFHASGNPATYLRSLQADYRTHRYFLPDDHASGLRIYLDERISAARARGDSATANRLRGYRLRVRGMGFSADDVIRATRRSVAWSRLSTTTGDGFTRWAAAARSWQGALRGISAGAATRSTARGVGLFAAGSPARGAAFGGFRAPLSRSLGRGATGRIIATRAITVVSVVGLAVTAYEIGTLLLDLYRDDKSRRKHLTDLSQVANQLRDRLDSEQERLREP